MDQPADSSDQEMLFQEYRLRIPEQLRYAFDPFCNPAYGYSVNGEVNETRAFLAHTVGKSELLDIGALFGFFSLLFSRHTGGHAIAVEPSGIAVRQAEVLARANDVSYERILAAMGAECGELRMGRDPGHDHLLVRASGEEIVPLLTIDHLCESRGIRPDAIKIDTEGYEFEILRGGARYLKKNRPTIFLELHLHSKYGNPTFYPYDIEEFADYIADSGYHIFNLFDEEIVSLPRYTEVVAAEHHRVVLLPRS